MTDKRIIGVDLGGTKISFIDICSPEKIISQRYVETPNSKAGIIGALVENIREMTGQEKGNRPVGIGLAVAGRIDPVKKCVVFSPNLPYKDEYPLGMELEKALGITVAMDNDANAAAIGEKVFGAAKDMQNFISLTLGTGIGSGIFVEGRILHGSENAGGEAGHMVVAANGPACNCGNRGCLESLCSGVAIARMAEERTGARKSAKEVCDSAVGGDETAKAILKEAGEYLGDGLVSLVNLFNPEALFFTGSLANAPGDYFEPAFRKVKEKSFGGSGRNLKMEVSRLGANIGAMGAAALIL